MSLVNNGYCFVINDGVVSRYIKPSLINNNKIDVTAFDLRDMTPPEKSVSFCFSRGANDQELFVSALSCISKLMPSRKDKGVIALFGIEETIESINDEDEDIIRFVDDRFPHCGMFYLTEDQAKIVEAKTTLCFLARKRMKFVGEIQNSISSVV